MKVETTIEELFGADYQILQSINDFNNKNMN